jgi:hypothetical protein
LFVCGYVGQVARPRGSKLKGQHQHQQTSKQKRKNREKNDHKNRFTVMLIKRVCLENQANVSSWFSSTRSLFATQKHSF